MRIQFGWVTVIAAALLLSSCGARKKASNEALYGHGYSRKNIPMSDASDSKDHSYTGTKLDNFAELLGVRTKDLNNQDLYLMIDEWMGAPHRYGGMNKRGVDCSGFVTLLYNRIYDKDLPRTSRDMAGQIKRKYRKQLKEGDLVFFSFGGRNIDHVGIYLHNDKFVHVSTRKGVIISSLNDAWYSKYLKRCGTPKG
ncbi:MAG: C40 family peptidase [Sphingobacterium sp.]